MTEKQQTFISLIYANCELFADDYGIKCIPAIVGQAIIESNWGNSVLSAKYHNYFGLKCGSSWNGKSVNLTTKEEYKAGTFTTIKDNFRVYDCMKNGVCGYFDFINTKRYANLKGVTDVMTYLERLKADGYATSSKYVNTVYKAVQNYVNPWLELDKEQNVLKPIKEVALEVIAGKWGNGSTRNIKLTQAGYNYKSVQSMVNSILRGRK